MLALYPVLKKTPKDKAQIESIFNAFGLSCRSNSRNRKFFGKYKGTAACLKAIENYFDEDVLGERMKQYLDEQSNKVQNDTYSCTIKILNSRSYDRWMACIHKLDYKNVWQHYCCGDVEY